MGMPGPCEHDPPDHEVAGSEAGKPASPMKVTNIPYYSQQVFALEGCGDSNQTMSSEQIITSGQAMNSEKDNGYSGRQRVLKKAMGMKKWNAGRIQNLPGMNLR